MIKYKLVTLISSLFFSFSVLANETPAVIGGVEMASGEKSAAFEQVRKKLGKWKGTMTQGATGAVFDVSYEFKLTSGEGAVHRSEVVGVVGSNGTGKSTMIKILAGEHEYDGGWVTAEATISYKPQHIDVDIDGSVQLWLDSELGPRWRSGEFK